MFLHAVWWCRNSPGNFAYTFCTFALSRDSFLPTTPTQLYDRQSARSVEELASPQLVYSARRGAAFASLCFFFCLSVNSHTNVCSSPISILEAYSSLMPSESCSPCQLRSLKWQRRLTLSNGNESITFSHNCPTSCLWHYLTLITRAVTPHWSGVTA